MPQSVTFRTVVELGGKTATGLPVPAEVLEALGGGRRPAVLVTVGDHSYRSTVGTMGGRQLVPLSAENRTAAGVEAGDEVEVTLTADAEPREVTLPEDLAALLAADDVARAHFDSLTFTYRKEWVSWITSAKKPETRERRLEATLDGLRAGRKTH